MFTFTREELGWEEPEVEKTPAEDENVLSTPKYFNEDGTPIADRDAKYLFQERPTLGEFTGKMLGAGTDQVQGLAFAGVGLAGDVVGSDAVKDFGLEGYQRNMQDAAVAREEAGMVDFDEIDGVGSAGKWAYGTLLEQLPQLAPTLALGGAGGIAGRQLVKKGLQEVIEEGVSAGLSRKAAEAAVANAVASRGGAKAFLTGTVDKAAARQLMEGGFTREATEAALGRVAAGKLAPQVGVAAGNIASGQAMSMGSIYGDTEDAGLAVTYGAAAGAVEGLADTVLFSPFAKRAFGVDVAERSIKNKTPGTWTTETPNSKTKITIGSPVIDKAAKGFVKGVAVEGPLEEYPQTYIEQLAKLKDNPNYYGPDGIDSEQAKRERLNAMAAGSVVGGTIGPVGGALEAYAPRTKNALQGLVQKPLSDPETGLPNEPDPFTSEAREYEPEAYDIGNGINARRFKIKGTETTGWAIDNPTEAVLKEFGNSGYVDDGKLILTSNSAGNTLAVRGDTARAKALGKIQEDDDQEEQSKEPEKREPLDITPGKLPTDVLPIETPGATYGRESEIYDVFSEVRKKPLALETETAPSDAGVLDNKIEDEGWQGGALTQQDNTLSAIELSKTTLALPEVDIVNAVEDPDETSISLLDDAQKSLENAITQIEKRDIPQAEKEEATKPLYDKLLQVDEIQQLYTPEKAPSALLTPTTPLEQEVEKQVAEYQQKVAEQKQAQAEALEARTPEQTQGFIASLKQGDNVTVDLDGPNDINGTFEGTTDEGQVIVRDKKTRKRQVAPKENVTLTVDLPEAPTKASVLRDALDEDPTEQTLIKKGYKPTRSTITERIGDDTFERPTYTTTEKDKIEQRPLTVTATFYNVNGKATPNFHYVHEGNTEKEKTWTRDILRAMDRGYEARIPNSVEVPAGVQTEAVEGTDYRVVTGLDFTFDGVNFGTFLRGNKGVRHNGREDEGVFAEAWNTNPDYNNIRLQRSIDNNKARQEHGTDSTTKAGKRASGLNPIGQSIFQAIFGSPVQDENKNQVWPTGSFGGSIEFYLNTRARGLDEIGRDGFTYGAQDKFFRAIGKTKGLTDDADLSPEQQALVDSTISAYLSTQRSGGVEFAGSGKLTQDTINKLKKDLTSEPKSPEAKLVNRTLNAMQALAMFSNPRTQVSALSGVAATEYKKQAVRPKGSVSLNQNIGESGEATVADILTVNAQGGARAQEEKENLNAAPGEVSKEQKATIAKQKKVNADIANSLDDDFATGLDALRVALNPAGKIAFDWIKTTDKAAKQKLYGQLEDRLEQDRDETSPDDIIADVQEEIAGLARRASGRTYSPAVRSSVGSSGTGATAGLEGGVLNRTSKTAEIRRIKRRYIQGKAGLSDEQMLAMADDEIDRAYLYFNARADEARAAKAQDAVVSAAPAIDQLVDLDSASLLSEYARELAQDLKAGEMGKIREANFAELTRLGAFASTREFLSRIADPAYKMPRDMQLRAKAFLDLEKKRGFKLDAIEIQAANFLQTGTQDRASWAGLMGRNADYTSFGIYLNLDQAHDRFSAANTALHELAHVTVLAKKHGKVKLSKDEEKAIADLETLRRRAVLRAGDASPAMKAAADAAGITDPAAKVDFYEKEIRKEVARNPEFRGYNGLQNFDEFVVEMTGSPEFVDLLARLGFGTATGKQGFSGMIRDAFKAILKLINSNISADSEIGRAFMDSWNLIYAGTKPTVAPGELLQATRGITATETKPQKAATVKKSQKPKAPQTAPAQPSTTSNAETTQAPQSNNQPTAQPVPENAEVPEASRPGEGSGAAVEKRGKGRPPKREMRDRTALPATREAFEAEMAQGEMTPEERAELDDEAPQSPAGRLQGAMASIKGVISNIDDTLSKLEVPDLKDPNRYEAIAKAYPSRSLFELGRSVDRLREEANLARREVRRLGGVFNLFSFKDRKIAQERFNILQPKYRELSEKFLRLQNEEFQKKVFTSNLDLKKEADETIQKFEDAFQAIALLNEATEIISRPDEFAPQSPAGRRPRAIPASPFAEGEREMAELRAENFADILFYAGMSEEDFYNAVGLGVASLEELEKEYINDVSQMLGNIAGDSEVPAPLRHVAQMLLDQGHDFSKVRFRVAREEIDGAATYTPGRSASRGEIAVHLDSEHLGGIAQTIVHEALHHVSYYKASPGYRLTATERKALRDIERIRKFAERAAIAKNLLPGENVTEARRRLQSSDRSLYGLTEVDEFITEILTNPSFQSFLVGIKPMQGIEKKGGLIRNLLDQVLSYLKDFIFGMDVSGDSLLTQGLDNVMSLIQTPQDPRKVSEVAAAIDWNLASRATMPEADNIAYSPAGDAKKMIAKLTGAETKTTFTGGTYEKGGLLSTDGKLDKRAGDLWRKRNMQVGAQERMVNIAVNKLVNAVKAARKAGQEPPTNLMNTALGNLDNPLTQAQRTEIKRLREIDEEAANAQEGAYMAKNREAFKVKQAEALRQLPTEIAEAIQEMTEHITALSGALKKAGILEPGLAATIDANLGIYLHRSYEIFDNPAHKDKIKKDEVVMTAAENLLRRQIESRNAQKLIDDVAKAGGILSKADAERQARGTAKREEIDRVMEQLLAVGEESLGGVILRGRIPGQKDLSILDARGNIAPEIQALWGRYEDPTINYAKTVMKISTLVANHQFLAETRSLGLQEGWLYEGEDHPPGYLKIASENNKSLAPLAGLYGNRDLVEALYAMYPPAGIAENYEWVKFFAKLTGMSMASKTVLSAASHVRNFAGNFLNLAASGNLGINDILNGGRYKKALDLTIRSTFSNASAQQFKDTIKELVELGVLNESLTAGLLNDLIGTKRVAQNPMDFSDRILDMLVKKPAAAIWDNAQKSYQSGDEFFKVVIYLSELDKYRKAMPQWSEQQLKENAAKIARDVHWTYSLSPVAVGKIKQFPFIAPFITFTTEVIRTTKNTMELAYREIKEGNRTGNKELAAIGWKRVRGMGIAAFAPTIIAGAVGAAAGISGEDDDDLRRFLPDWQKNSQLLVFKNKDGKVSFVDVSYLDPYEYWKRPITAFLRALGADSESTAMERIAQGAVDAGAQLLNPFAAEQILSGAILDIARNKKESGQELWNPQDTGTRIAAKIGDHLWNAMEPGTLVTAGRIINAATGTVSDSGRSYGLMNEIASVALGQRVSELDVEQSLGFKSSQYARNLRDASSLFTREFSNRGTRSADQIMDAYNRANDATFDLGKEFREDLLSAIRLGKISQKRAQEILSASRLSKEDIKMLRTGRYLRYEPSPQQIKLAKELGNENRIRDVRQAERAAATNIPLR